MIYYYYYFLSFMVMLIIFFGFRSFHLHKEDILSKLFSNALRNENNGQFEAAIISYEIALKEVNKNKYQIGMKNKIVEKLKILRSIIEYKNNLNFLWCR